MTRLTARLIAMTTLCLACLPINAALAADLNGSWRGGGTMTLNSGNSESVRCRADYNEESSNVYSVSATCTTGAARVTQSAELHRLTANAYSGTFQNTEYGVTGRIYVRVDGNKQIVRLSSSSGSANLSLSKR